MQIAGSFGISYHGDNQNEYNQQNIALIFSLFCHYTHPREGTETTTTNGKTLTEDILYSSPRGDGNRAEHYECYVAEDYTHPREGTETPDTD